MDEQWPAMEASFFDLKYPLTNEPIVRPRRSLARWIRHWQSIRYGRRSSLPMANNAACNVHNALFDTILKKHLQNVVDSWHQHFASVRLRTVVPCTPVENPSSFPWLGDREGTNNYPSVPVTNDCALAFLEFGHVLLDVIGGRSVLRFAGMFAGSGKAHFGFRFIYARAISTPMAQSRGISALPLMQTHTHHWLHHKIVELLGSVDPLVFLPAVAFYLSLFGVTVPSSLSGSDPEPAFSRARVHLSRPRIT
ncbi:hypothetical protein BD410DRAFT_442980 [Rickenella mellea]|uniref:Uncharacterized protein n=1 Tax=Rickenella mellea TaxID=50990 RepID=A0A4Y7PW10_9AGAM|nr:hypothetical protein BD410DRAFT_442980 [Rickenella mellea]